MSQHINACRAVLSAIDMDDFPESVMLDYKHAESLNPESSARSVELPDGSSILFEQLTKIKGMKAAIEEQESKLKAQIGMFLEDADTGTIDGNKVVTWKTQTRDSFDMKRFESEHPALVEKYRKQTTFRVMRFI
jgi:predicted phage-related endonuclease